MKKILIFFLDAFKPEYISQSNTPFLFELSNKFKILRVETLLGYSAGIHPSIWTGAYQDTHGIWTHFYYDGKRKGSLLSKANSMLPTRALKAFFRHSIMRSAKILLNKIEPPDFYSPLSYKSLGIKNTALKTLFDVFVENNLSFEKQLMHTYHRKKEKDWKYKDSNFDVDIFFTYSIDELGHKYGTKSKEIADAVKSIDNHIKEIFRHFNNKCQDVTIIIFSDHGMTDIKGYIDLEKIISKRLKEKGLDKSEIIQFYDSTLARFWLKDKNIEDFRDIFKNIENVTIIDNQSRKRFRLNFPTNIYGDIILLADPGYEIFPSFYHGLFRNYFKAMHGYRPYDKDSYGIFLCNKLNTERITLNIVDIFPTICNILSLRIPKTCEGRSIHISEEDLCKKSYQTTVSRFQSSYP